MICWFTVDGLSVCCIQWRIFMHSSGWVCFCEYRAIFNWVSEIIRDCFGFAIAHFSVIGPEISRYPPNQSDTNYNQSWPGHKRFPALQAMYLFLLWFLIGWWWCTPFVWLVAGITLVGVSTSRSLTHCLGLVKAWRKALKCLFWLIALEFLLVYHCAVCKIRAVMFVMRWRRTRLL